MVKSSKNDILPPKNNQIEFRYLKNYLIYYSKTLVYLKLTREIKIMKLHEEKM